MPAKRCIETKNMCLLFVDYCITLSIPKIFHLFGYFFHSHSLYTQNISSLWVFLPFLRSLYPKHFISLGISSVLTLSVPKTFHLFGYFSHFCSLHTQSYFFSWVFRLFSSPYTPNAMLHVHTMAYHRSVFRLTHTRRILQSRILRLRRVASTT